MGLDLTIHEGETKRPVGAPGAGKLLTALATMGLRPQVRRVISGAVVWPGERLPGLPISRLRQLPATQWSMLFQEPMTALTRSNGLTARSRKRGKSTATRACRTCWIQCACRITSDLMVPVLPQQADLPARRGPGILFLTNILGVEAQICDEVMVMRRAAVVEYRPAGQALAAPKHEYTRALIEAAPGHHRDFTPLRPFTEAGTMNPVELPFDADTMLAGLRPWIETESPTWEAAAVNRMMDVAARELFTLGAQVDRIPGALEPTGVRMGDSLRARFAHPKAGEPGILILGHLDTVHPVGTLKVLPFRRDETHAWGPGLCDMKGGNYLTLEAIRQLARAGIATKLPVTVLFTPDEEIGSPTSRALIEAEAARAKIVLVPEPGLLGGGVTTGRFAIARFNLKALGRPSHAGARLAQGRSAIRELCRRVLQIEDLTTEACTFSVGVVHGGTWVNCVSSEARGEALSMAKRQEDLDRGVEAMLALSDAETGFVVTRGVTRPVWEPSSATLELAAITEALHRQVGIGFSHKSQGGGSDGNFTGAMLVPTLDGLGVEGDGIHTLNEHIDIASLVDRARVMAGLLARIG